MNNALTPAALPPRATLACQLVFVLVGVSSMYYWNAVINVLYSVIVVRAPGDVVTITNVYTSVAVVCAFVLSIFGAATPYHYYSGGVLLAAMCLLFPPIALYTDGRLCSVLLHLAGAVAGCGEMLFQCAGFSFAVILSKRFAGYISFGYGACGVLTFVVWYLLSQRIWRRENEAGVWRFDQMERAIWTQFVIGFVLIAACLFATAYVLALPQMKAALYMAKHNIERSVIVSDEPVRLLLAAPSAVSCEDDRTWQKTGTSPALSLTFLQDGNEQPEEYGRRWLKTKAGDLWHIFVETWQLQVGLGLSQGISMMAFPLIAPYQYHLGQRRNDILTGVFQCGDFVGRYIPNLAFVLPVLLLPARAMLPLTLARLVILAIMIMTARDSHYGHRTILTRYSSETILMAALALSHGYYASVFMIRMTESLKNPQHKVKASAMAVCLLVACIAIGMWLARLVRFE